MHLSEDIGSRLQEERKRHGMTQNQVAETLGIAKRTQANYEAGTSDATASYLSKAASELGFDIPYILNGVRTTMTHHSLTQGEDVLIKQFRSITPFDQEAIRRFLQAMADDAARHRN